MMVSWMEAFASKESDCDLEIIASVKESDRRSVRTQNIMPDIGRMSGAPTVIKHWTSNRSLIVARKQ